MNRDPNKHSVDPPPHDDDLRQLLLELHYGLLEDDEADSLHQRINRDPAVAKAWAQTLVMAGKFAEAAKVNAPQRAATELPAEAPVPANLPASSARSNRFMRLWFGSLVTAATIAITVSGLKYWSQWPAAPPSQIRVAVQPIAGADALARNEFLVSVGPESDVDSPIGDNGFDPSMPIVPATISFKVLSQGAVLFFGSAQTAPSQPCRIRVPDDIAIPGDAVLHVDATQVGDSNVVRLTVPLEPTRCLTFVSTDRPVYRPGETVYFRSVTLNRRTLAANVDVPIRFELIDPSGSAVSDCVIEGVTERGVGSGAFVVPESAAGGAFKLVAKSLDDFFPDQSCDLEVRRYRAVRLKTDLQFGKRSFSGGDRVEANLVVRRADDQIPSFATARAKAVVDGNIVYQADLSLDDQGQLSIAFDLPKLIRSSNATLSIAIDDGSVTETAARPIPIHTGRAEIEFYPEGGYLVGGVDNRVYFAARDIDGKPIEITGEILSQSGRMVASVKTVRDGMGRFEFKPESGMRYSLRITSPQDITETPWLPSVVEALPVLDAGPGVYAAGQPIQITLHSTKRRQVIVRAVCRGELVGVKTIDLGLGETAVSVPIQDRAAGVIRVTVLDTEGDTALPLVERLVYRRDTKRLNISATMDGPQRVQTPGESVRMTLSVTDENDAPVVGAVLGVSVVDDTALSLRQQDLPSIRTHFLLTSEIQSPEDLEHADVYLADGPEAANSLDLLLGTQGWRRFVSGSPDQGKESFRDQLARLIELDGRRAGLVADVQSNQVTLRQQIMDYRRQANQVWSQFVDEIRWVLMIIGALWLVGFLLRPRKPTVVAATMLLLAGVILTHAGCGSQHVTSMSPAATESDTASRAMKAGQEMEGASAMNSQPERPAEALEMQLQADPSDEASDGETRPAFVQRVVGIFLGNRGRSSTEKIDPSRLTPDQLQRWAKARDVDAQALADQLMDELRFPIRQYAHLHQAADDNVRRDFTETLYWNPLMVTDSTGTATIRFDLSDSLTKFGVHVDAHSADGRIGSGGGSVVTRLPLQVEAKVPLEVTVGDRIDLPVGIINGTGQAGQFDISLEVDPAFGSDRISATTSIAADGRTTEVFSLKVGEPTASTQTKLTVLAQQQGGSLSDHVERVVNIVADGFPFAVSQSGTLSEDVSVPLNLPDQIVGGSLTGRIEIYPSTQSQLSAGLESILREPHGCFEQASASNYPNVMAFQLMQLDATADDSDQRRIISLLRRGYRKLTSYECSTLGYEWFGNDPGHEALSAFGLMQFSEMSKFVSVDQAMMERTRRWLLDRRDGQGGFQRNPRHLHAWSVNQDVVNAYLLWALSQADVATGDSQRIESELSAELDRMQQVAENSTDPYLMSLSAITLINVGRGAAASKLLDRMVQQQQPDGSFIGQTTVTQSGGISRTVETTSLAILAFQAAQAKQSQSRRAAGWLVDHRQSGGFGSTQATVLALKALIAVHDTVVGGEGGQVQVLVDEKVVDLIKWQGRPGDGVQWSMSAAILKQLAASATLSLRAVDGAALPFTVQVNGHTTAPESDAACPIEIGVQFADDRLSVAAGDTIDVIADVRNKTDQGRPMTVATVGLPGGLEPVIESLDKLRKTGVIDYYELRGRKLVLYWRTLAPNQSHQIVIPCVAQVGGRYTGPASSAYLYYTAESKSWSAPLTIEVSKPVG
ncbi:MG2 domain-containing protein [Stieleria sp. TO1_6]|uniref:MG2 domain-containing protein n=1 Tax=Stieleria tagensis TaxID=2956795 RepID=UPI00209B3F07|nr:MG2 domain-containing protein [Stieleria tagensis]MCO8122456.1 MG2 domain-containing protein [Stieleria tagensis]